jgi:predicted nucleotidyltransferase
MEPLAAEFARLIRQGLGDHVRQIVLFGSRARGDARAGSDFDVLIVVDQSDPELRERVLDASVEMLDRHSALFATILRSEEVWRQSQGFPLAMNIAREGRAL